MPNLVSSRRMSSASVDFLSAWVDSTADGGTGVTLSSQAVAIGRYPPDLPSPRRRPAIARSRPPERKAENGKRRVCSGSHLSPRRGRSD